MQVRYRYRLYPGPVQQRALVRAFGCVRVVYNDCPSQVCSAGGAKDGPKPLHIREWACGTCGTLHDRDVNAARNILAAGRADRRNARGGQARPGPVPAPASETGTHRGAA